MPPKKPEPQPFGRTWDKQDAALRAPVSVLPDEEQVSDPEEDIDPELELADGRTVDADGVISEPVVPTIELGPAIQCFASIMKHDIAKGSQGRTWTIGIEVDTPFEAEFVSLMEEATFSLFLNKYEAARDGVRVARVTTATNAAQEKSTKVVLNITEDQIGLSGPVGLMVGEYVPLEMYRMQMTLDLTLRAE